MLKWVLIAVGGLVGVVVLMGLVGLFLPREHVASSSLVIRQPPDSVWMVVRDLGHTAEWWPQVERVERMADARGREVWRQQTRNGGPMSLVVTDEAAPTRLVTEIDAAAGAPFGGTWTYEIRQAEGGSRVTITERGWIANPFFRLMANVVFGMHATMDSYLQALARRFNEDVTPVHET